jgi:hypothetical protein
MKNPCLNAALAELEAAGVRDVEIVRGSKHPQIRFRVNGGPGLQVFACPGTSSDYRAPANTRRDIRALLRRCGINTDRERLAKPPLKPDRLTLLERRVAALEERLAKEEK